jgi:4-hydroxy-tetrahydrodipicolinate synthase
MERQSPAIEGVMGGAGGRFLMTERTRGAVGVIVACEFCDILQRIWELLDMGDTAAAEDLFDRVLPGIVLEGLMGMAFAKEVMVRRGVLKNNKMRNLSRGLDKYDMLEIDRALARIEPYYVWRQS